MLRGARYYLVTRDMVRTAIHRDIKPGNIMISKMGQPVLLDFGLARDDDPDAPALTQTGDLFGTPAYMSPEQLLGQRIGVDRRTDVWSLGITLHECLTLQRPFTAPTRQALYQMIMTQSAPNPRQVNSHIPPELSVVVATALEKDRDRRYQTAEELADELQRIRLYQPIHAKPAGRWLRIRRWAQRNPGAAAAAICLTVGFLVSMFLLREQIIANQMTEAEAERADRQRQRAEDEKRAYTRLANARKLELLIRESRVELWPATPDKVEPRNGQPSMTEWIKRAGDLAREMPQMRADLAELENETGLENEEKWRRERLGELVADLEEFVADTTVGVTIKEMEARREFARTIRERTIVEPADKWRDARNGVLQNKKYGGLTLKPQLGLIPIGPDPVSTLWEFAHLQTGNIPKRDPETKRLILTEDMAIVFVLIPGGTFTMGAQGKDETAPNYYQKANEKESPPHEVTLSAFFMSKYEMTQGQWMRFRGQNPSQYPPGYVPADGLATHTALHPVEQMAWAEAYTIMKQLGLELPTEARWEYACRAGATTLWSCGNDKKDLSSVANLADISARAWDKNWEWIDDDLDDGYAAHSPVGSFAANGFGLHDMHGNVWEWCQDYVVSYDNPTRSGDGLRGHEGFSNEPHRVTRGGSFYDSLNVSRTTFRNLSAPLFRSSVSGLRPSRSIDE